MCYIEGRAADALVDEPLQMRSHFGLPVTAIAPFPWQEPAAATYVRLLPLPRVPPQPQLRFDPVEGDKLFVGPIRVSPVSTHRTLPLKQTGVLLTRKIHARRAGSQKNRAISIYYKELRIVFQPRGIGCDCLQGYVPSFQISNI